MLKKIQYKTKILLSYLLNKSILHNILNVQIFVNNYFKGHFVIH